MAAAVADGAAVAFQSCFTEPTFRTFYALGGGFLAQTGRRTVCGMLVGARLWQGGSTTWRTGSSPPPDGRSVR